MTDEVRMIDVELLRTNIAQIAKNCARSDAQKALIGRILFMIDNMPTVEAEPVKHGKWEMNSDYPDRLICNQCNSTYDVYFSERDSLHYCSNCGCYMREEGESDG